MRQIKILNSIINIEQGDITNQDTEAIVNAANNQLSPGGGVSGAIHKAAGLKLWEECKKINGCKTGEAKITKGYNLKAKYVIHTVGPIYSKSEDDQIRLSECYRNSLNIAFNKNIKSISFPAISTGIFGYPKKEAAEIAIKTIKNQLIERNKKIVVKFILYDDENYKIYLHTLGK